jgi:hypothetical protein
LKQDFELQNIADERPSKKQCLAFRNKDDMKWLQNEITGVKENLEKMAAEAREDRLVINSTLQELLHKIQRNP